MIGLCVDIVGYGLVVLGLVVLAIVILWPMPESELDDAVLRARGDLWGPE